MKDELNKQGVVLSLVESHKLGGEGAEDIANKVVELSSKVNDFKYAYESKDSVKEKIEKVALKVYGASKVEYTEEVEKKIEKIAELGYSDFQICIAKTQYSLSDDPKNLECNEPFTLYVSDIWLRTGAEFIVAITGKIMTMPGLPRVPAAEKIDINENDEIIGIF